MRTQPIFQRILFLVLISGVVAALPSSGFAAPPNLLSGYTIHVVALHIMDGEIIGPFHYYCKPIWPADAPIPDGSVSIAQSVGYWEALHGQTGDTAVSPPASGGPGLSMEALKKMGIVEIYQNW